MLIDVDELVLTAVIVTVIQLALVRSWGYDFDLKAAILINDPERLARALNMLKSSNARAGKRICPPQHLSLS